MKRTLLLCLAACALPSLSLGYSDCKHLSQVNVAGYDGRTYRWDLSSLGGLSSPDFQCDEQVGFDAHQHAHKYVLNLCHDNHMQCDGKSGMVTQFLMSKKTAMEMLSMPLSSLTNVVRQGGSTLTNLACEGVLARTESVAWTLIDPYDPQRGLRIVHANGDPCPATSGPRSVAIELECLVGGEHEFYSCAETSNCKYEFKIRSPAGCFVESFPTPLLSNPPVAPQPDPLSSVGLLPVQQKAPGGWNAPVPLPAWPGADGPVPPVASWQSSGSSGNGLAGGLPGGDVTLNAASTPYDLYMLRMGSPPQPPQVQPPALQQQQPFQPPVPQPLPVDPLLSLQKAQQSLFNSLQKETSQTALQQPLALAQKPTLGSSWIVTIFRWICMAFAALFVYVAFGTVYNMQRAGAAAGLDEAVPHGKLWKEMPHILQEAGRKTVHMVVTGGAAAANWAQGAAQANGIPVPNAQRGPTTTSFPSRGDYDNI